MVIRHVAMMLRIEGYVSLCGVSRVVLAGFCLNGAVEVDFPWLDFRRTLLKQPKPSASQTQTQIPSVLN
jgi:hypothetical protein